MPQLNILYPQSESSNTKQEWAISHCIIRQRDSKGTPKDFGLLNALHQLTLRPYHCRLQGNRILRVQHTMRM